MIDTMRARNPSLALTLQWVPGHKGIEGNEAADQQAKRAAGGESSSPERLPTILRSGLKTSKSAKKQELKTKVKLTALMAFKNSRRIARTEKLGPNTKHHAFIKHVGNLPRRHAVAHRDALFIICSILQQHQLHFNQLPAPR